MDLRGLARPGLPPTVRKSTFARECLGEYCQYQYNNAPLFQDRGERCDVLPAADRQSASSLSESNPRRIRNVFQGLGGNHDSHLCQATTLWRQSWVAQSTVPRCETLRRARADTLSWSAIPAACWPVRVQVSTPRNDCWGILHSSRRFHPPTSKGISVCRGNSEAGPVGSWVL